jgi:hypothetical protein
MIYQLHTGSKDFMTSSDGLVEEELRAVLASEYH